MKIKLIDEVLRLQKEIHILKIRQILDSVKDPAKRRELELLIIDG